MLKGVSALVRLLWSICCFKRTPEDVPYSRTLLSIVVACQWILALLVWGKVRGWGYGLLAASIYVLTLLGLPYFVLLAARKSARYLQMQVALLGTSLLLNVIAGFIIVSLVLLVQLLPMLQSLVLLGVAAIVIWTVLVQGTIYQCTLEKSRFFGVCIALFVLLASGNLFEWLLRAFTWLKDSL